MASKLKENIGLTVKYNNVVSKDTILHLIQADRLNKRSYTKASDIIKYIDDYINSSVINTSNKVDVNFTIDYDGKKLDLLKKDADGYYMIDVEKLCSELDIKEPEKVVFTEEDYIWK